MEPGKIQSIRDYLQKHFPSSIHDDMNDFSRGAHKFKIKTASGILLVLFSEEFIDVNDSETIVSKLEKFNLIYHLRDSYSLIVIVTNNGIKFESKFWGEIKKSLEDSRYKWRTPRGVAKETGLSIEEVKKAFNIHSDVVIKSSIPSNTGEELYTTREHFRKLQSPFVKITSSLFTRVSSSTGSSGED